MSETAAQRPEISISFVDDILICSDKAALLSDVDFGDISFAGTEGAKRYLRDLSVELKWIGEQLNEALVATREKNTE